MLKHKITSNDQQKTILAGSNQLTAVICEIWMQQNEILHPRFVNVTLIGGRNLLWPQLSLQGMPHLNNCTFLSQKRKENPPLKAFFQTTLNLITQSAQYEPHKLSVTICTSPLADQIQQHNLHSSAQIDDIQIQKDRSTFDASCLSART